MGPRIFPPTGLPLAHKRTHTPLHPLSRPPCLTRAPVATRLSMPPRSHSASREASTMMLASSVSKHLSFMRKQATHWAHLSLSPTFLSLSPVHFAFALLGKECGVKLSLKTLNSREGQIFCGSHKPYDAPNQVIDSSMSTALCKFSSAIIAFFPLASWVVRSAFILHPLFCLAA